MENNMGGQKKPEKVPQRLWQTNEIGLKFLVKEIKVAGKENIKEIPPGAKVVIMTTHLSDIDVPLAIHAVAKELNVSVMNVSIHHKFWGSQGEKPSYISLQLAGKDNFLPIDFKNLPSGEKRQKAFNPENFEPAVEALDEGKGVIIAAHRGTSEALENLEGVREGHGGVYLAELTDAYILPITVALDRKTGIFKPGTGFAKTIVEKPNASIVIGKPFQLEKIDGIENISKLNKKRKDGNILDKEEIAEFSRLADALREKSKAVMEKLSIQLLENKKMLETT